MKKNAFPLLIAEIANCHAGDEVYLFELVDGVCQTAADAVKFQLIIADELLVPHHSQYSLFKSFEFSFSFWKKVVARVKAAHKKVAFDVFGDRSLALAADLNADLFKVYASDVDDLEFIKKVVGLKKKVFVSTGGAELKEIERIIKLPGGEKLCFLLGFQSFPTPPEESQLNRLEYLRERYGCNVGFMDHSDPRDLFAAVLPCLAVAKGACAVEKHVYLANRKKTYDWQSAIDFHELDKLRALLVKTQAACGSGEFKLTRLEKEYFLKKRKIAVAARALEAGEKLKANSLAFKLGEMVGGEKGLYRKEIADYLGRKLRRVVGKDEILLRNMFVKG
ncbi:MAG: N-acetylneuraminate synthase family protein [Candidatus Margulisbacteria bacterium]|nr:N-acetylneuraminate synthase family protein [Candidatus Margulisiibacteriota bacterium]MBU1616423.1 N-acetylneuraminate synthase family protein [Candidatus Margulisiibacteriota bacterium]